MTIRFSRWAAPLAAGLGLMAASTLGASADDIKIAHVYGKTGRA
jgi:branched-chain amino acid transport system substrate-binding protein